MQHLPARTTASTVLCLALAAELVTLPVRAAGQASAIPQKPDDRTIVHVLNRLGFGPAPGDIERVRRMGLETYIEQQLHPERIPDTSLTSRLSGFRTLTLTTRELTESIYLPAQMARREVQRRRAAQDAAPSMSAAGSSPAGMPMRHRSAIRAERQVLIDLSQQKILRAAYSERQLEEVMVDFWFNHFNVFAGKGLTRRYLVEYERAVIRPHALGRFRDLLGATAESPAMLFYLDNWRSAAPAGDAMTVRGRRPRLVPRGPQAPGPRRTMADLPANSPNRPRGLNENYARELLELHTLGVEGGYSQQDVQEVARAFTGWTIANPRQGGGFAFEPRMHDNGEKVVLGHTIPPGGGKKDGDRVLDILAAHPSTARYVATRLARRFVADEPPAALVNRAAKRFLDTRGDIREVLRTIITSPEFFAAPAYRAKIKTPFEFVVSAVRATGADVVNATPLVQAVRRLGMPLYMCQPPTGYPDTADRWVNTGALLGRMNFALALSGGRLRAVRINAGADAASAAGTLRARIFANDVSEATAEAVAKASTAPQAVSLILGAPEFQKR